jgi:hypothetical protein
MVFFISAFTVEFLESCYKTPNSGTLNPQILKLWFNLSVMWVEHHIFKSSLYDYYADSFKSHFIQVFTRKSYHAIKESLFLWSLLSHYNWSHYQLQFDSNLPLLWVPVSISYCHLYCFSCILCMNLTFRTLQISIKFV